MSRPRAAPFSVSASHRRGGGTDEWDRAYLPGLFVASVQPYLDEYAHRSALARRELDWRALRYGPDRAELLHFFPAPRPDAPLLVFVHGGYWQQLTEADSSFAARTTVAAGAAYAAGRSSSTRATGQATSTCYGKVVNIASVGGGIAAFPELAGHTPRGTCGAR